MLLHSVSESTRKDNYRRYWPDEHFSLAVQLCCTEQDPFEKSSELGHLALVQCKGSSSVWKFAAGLKDRFPLSSTKEKLQRVYLNTILSSTSEG